LVLCSQILAVAAYGNVKIDTPAYTHFESNKKPEYLAKFPGGKIPAFEGSDGFRLTETTAVAKYSESFILVPSSFNIPCDETIPIQLSLS
jgi:elongation factor 1-gamma